MEKINKVKTNLQLDEYMLHQAISTYWCKDFNLTNIVIHAFRQVWYVKNQTENDELDVCIKRINRCSNSILESHE